MGAGAAGAFVYWIIGIGVWTILACIPFRARLGRGWSVYLVLYLIASTGMIGVLVSTAGPGGAVGWLVAPLMPGAVIALLRLGLASRA